MDLMVAGKWVSGRSHEEIAKRHGVSPATVKDWATSASRVIRQLMEGDKDDLRARMLATLETVVEKAMSTRDTFTTGVGREMVSEFYDAPDLRAAVGAIDTSAKLLGLNAKTELEVTLRAKQLEELPPDAMLAQVEDRITKLTELRDKLRAELGVKKGKGRKS